METIEQLQQDNAKLQERLNNAAKFFREQKAQIETLTNEVKEKTELALDYRNQIKTLTEKVDLLEHDTECFNSLQKSYEDTIESKDKAYEVLQNTYNEVWAENKQLKEQTENGVNNLEDLQKQLNEYELKLQNSEASYEQLNKKYEARKKQIAELTGNIEVQKNEYENKITSLKDDIKTLNDDVIKQKQEIEKLQIEKSDLEININDLTNRLSKSVNGKTKYQEFTEMIINLVDSFNNNGNNIDTDKHSSITVNTYKNSTGSQFMSDAPGMNI